MLLNVVTSGIIFSGGGGPVDPGTPAGSEVITGDIVVLRRSALGIAPEQPLFAVENIQNSGIAPPASGVVDDAQFHHLHFRWEFGFERDWQGDANIEHPDAAVAWGPRAAPLFKEPGTYPIRCTVTNMFNQNYGVLTFNHVVSDPETVFAGSNTVVVDTNGNGDFTTFDAAMSSVLGQDTTPKRIQVTRGQNHSWAGRGLGNSTGARVPSLHIEMVGPGAEPVFTKSNANTGFFWQDSATTGSGNDKDFVVNGGEWVGIYNPVSGTPSSGIGGFYQCLQNPPQHALFLGAGMRGFSNIISVEGTDTGQINAYTAMSENDLSDWNLYGIFGQRGMYAVTGNKIACNLDGLQGGSRGQGHVEGGAIRMPFARRAVIGHNEFYANSGWFQNFAPYYTNQPCVRWCTSPRSGEELVMNCNSFEAGFAPVELKPQNNSEVSQPVKALVEKNTFVGNWHSPWLLAVYLGGMTIRNNRFIHANVARPFGPFDPQAFVRLGREGADVANLSARIEVYGNTGINWMTDASYNQDRGAIPMLSDPVGYTSKVEGGNLTYQPNQGDIADGPLDETVIFAPKYSGYESAAVSPKETQWATPAGTVINGAPQSGSAALGDADTAAMMPIDDFYGNLRPLTNRDRGAVQVSV